MSDPYRPPTNAGPGPLEAWPPPVYAARPPGVPYDRDGDHLRLLSIFYYIWGGLTIFFSSFLLFDFYVGMTMLSQQGFTPHPGVVPPPNVPTMGTMKSMGIMMEVIGGGGTAIGWLLGGLTIYAGRCLATQRHALFITIIAALNCLSIPLGTLLGVFTFIVTARPTVKALFAQR
jgi:hypothetical protein